MPYCDKAENTNLKCSLLEMHVAHTKPSRYAKIVCGTCVFLTFRKPTSSNSA